MNELETLNMLLRAIGSSPVNSLQTDHPDAGNAKDTMDRIRGRAQRRGWWCNIDYDVTLEPNASDEVVMIGVVSSLVLSDRAYTLRGNKLYNKHTQSSKIYSTVHATRIVRVLDWDDMPPVMQEYCAYYAAAEFVRDELEDPQKESSMRESASASLLDLKKQDLEEGQYNIFAKPRVLRARSGIRPYGRDNSRFTGDPDA